MHRPSPAWRSRHLSCSISSSVPPWWPSSPCADLLTEVSTLNSCACCGIRQRPAVPASLAERDGFLRKIANFDHSTARRPWRMLLVLGERGSGDALEHEAGGGGD